MVKEKFVIVWDDEALIEFQEILEYLSERSIQVARLVKKSILSNIKLILKSPYVFEMDKLKYEPDPFFRAFFAYNYRVGYQIVIGSYEIRILRIRHTSREPLNY